MPHIAVNFDEVPDFVPPISTGIYTFRIVSANVEEVRNKPDREKVVLELEVDMDGNEFHGRKQFEHIGISHERGRTTIKQVCMAVGLVVGAGGLDTDELIGRTLQARIKQGTYTDSSGEVRENARVAGYLWRKEDIEAAAVV